MNSLRLNAVPDVWKRRSFTSAKPLAQYVQELVLRLEFFRDWVDQGEPIVFWLPGFFFTHVSAHAWGPNAWVHRLPLFDDLLFAPCSKSAQAFLTASLQNFARANRVPIDEIAFDFECLVMPSEWGLGFVGAGNASSASLRMSSSGLMRLGGMFRPLPTVTKPELGVFVHGLHLEGAAWDPHLGEMVEPEAKELYSTAPVIHFLPKRLADIQHGEDVYECPVYRTTERRGALTTTGHSSNHLIDIRLPRGRYSNEHWIMRGAALLCSLAE